jgi:type II secretory pathway component PulF
MSDSRVWAIIVGAIVVLIVYGIVSSKIKARQSRKRAVKRLPEVHDLFHQDRTYRVVLTSGLVLNDVRFQGITLADSTAASDMPFPLQQWLVLLKPDGKRVFVKPNAVRLYEEQ